MPMFDYSRTIRISFASTFELWLFRYTRNENIANQNFSCARGRICKLSCTSRILSKSYINIPTPTRSLHAKTLESSPQHRPDYTVSVLVPLQPQVHSTPPSLLGLDTSLQSTRMMTLLVFRCEMTSLHGSVPTIVEATFSDPLSRNANAPCPKSLDVASIRPMSLFCPIFHALCSLVAGGLHQASDRDFSDSRPSAPSSSSNVSL